MWTTEKLNDVAILKLQGSLDVGVQKLLKEKIVETAQSLEKDVVLDFSQVEFIDSSCLGVLVSTNKSIKESRGDLKLASMSDEVKSIFEITRLNKVFEIYETTNEAIESFYRK